MLCHERHDISSQEHFPSTLPRLPPDKAARAHKKRYADSVVESLTNGLEAYAISLRMSLNDSEQCVGALAAKNLFFYFGNEDNVRLTHRVIWSLTARER